MRGHSVEHEIYVSILLTSTCKNRYRSFPGSLHVYTPDAEQKEAVDIKRNACWTKARVINLNELKTMMK